MAFTFNGIPLGGNFKARRSSFGIGSLIFMLLFGAVFIGVSFLFIGDDLRSRNWESVSGTITHVSQSTDSEGDTTYRPTVAYNVDGQTYTASPSYSSSQHYTTGDTQTVHYDPSNPSEGVIRTNGMGFFIYIFPIVGVLVIIFGVFGFIRNIRRSGQINHLKSSGTKVQGVVTAVGGSNSSNNNSVQITVSATGPNGQVHHYQSDSVNGFGVVGLAEYQTKPVAIDVYIDPIDPSKYYVDLDDIPEITPERIASLLKNASNQTSTPPFVTQASNPAEDISTKTPPLA